MAFDRYFSRRAHVAKFEYLIGPSRPLGKNSPSADALKGDPDLCALHKTSQSQKKSPPSMVVSWSSPNSDSETSAAAQGFVKKYPLKGANHEP